MLIHIPLLIAGACAVGHVCVAVFLIEAIKTQNTSDNRYLNKMLKNMSSTLIRFTLAAAIFLLTEIIVAALFIPKLSNLAQELSDWFDCS